MADFSRQLAVQDHKTPLPHEGAGLPRLCPAQHGDPRGTPAASGVSQTLLCCGPRALVSRQRLLARRAGGQLPGSAARAPARFLTS